MTVRKPASIEEIANDSEASPDIALFLPTLHGGGAERIQLRLAEHFLSHGLRVDFIVVKYLGSLRDQVPEGARFVCLNARFVLSSLPAFRRYLKLAKPKTVLSSTESPNIIACFTRLCGAPRHNLVIRVSNALIRSTPLWRDYRRWPWLLLVALSYPFADRIIAISEQLGGQLVNIPFVRKERVHVIYNPALNASFEARMSAPLPIPAPFAGEGPFVLAAGRLHPQKDYPTLFRAFAKVRAHRRCRLIVLGEGALGAELQALAHDLGIEDDTCFAGFVENPYPCMRRADVFVLSSAWEGLGNVLIEALAAGTPVVSTDCPTGPAEVLGHGRFGKLVPVGNADAMAAAILETLSRPKPPMSPELHEHLGKFHIETVGKQYVNLALGL